MPCKLSIMSSTVSALAIRCLMRSRQARKPASQSGFFGVTEIPSPCDMRSVYLNYEQGMKKVNQEIT